MQTFSMDSSFWRYKVYVDIRAGSLKRKRQTTVGLCTNTSTAHSYNLILFAV